MELSYCVVNTNGRELLLELPRGDPSAPTRPAPSTRSWCSTTPPTTARRRRWTRGFPEVRVIRRDRRAPGSPRTTRCSSREASGEFCLLLNEDSELLDGAVRALLDALGR